MKHLKTFKELNEARFGGIIGGGGNDGDYMGVTGLYTYINQYNVEEYERDIRLVIAGDDELMDGLDTVLSYRRNRKEMDDDDIEVDRISGGKKCGPNGCFFSGDYRQSPAFDIYKRLSIVMKANKPFRMKRYYEMEAARGVYLGSKHRSAQGKSFKEIGDMIMEELSITFDEYTFDHELTEENHNHFELLAYIEQSEEYPFDRPKEDIHSIFDVKLSSKFVKDLDKMKTIMEQYNCDAPSSYGKMYKHQVMVNNIQLCKQWSIDYNSLPKRR